jgi:RNA polymerase sigma-70 factor (ECF subfamily)
VRPESEGPKPEDYNIPLAQISTIWTMVSHAHGGPRQAEAEAQRRFMERYHGAVYRYFVTALRDHDAAQELFQEFAERFLRGDFKKFDPAKGRFRDYLGVVLRNMVRADRKRQASRLHLHLSDIPEPAANRLDDHGALDDEFLRSWRDELLTRTWEALKNERRRRGLPLHVVLDKSFRNPDLTSADLARQFSGELKPSTPLSAALVRKTLQLAREKFADLLVAEVARSLGDHTVERLEQELIELGLIGYCREALHLRWIIDS